MTSGKRGQILNLTPFSRYRSTIDLLIIETAIENNLFLLHDDKNFTKIAAAVNEFKEYK